MPAKLLAPVSKPIVVAATAESAARLPVLLPKSSVPVPLAFSVPVPLMLPEASFNIPLFAT